MTPGCGRVAAALRLWIFWTLTACGVKAGQRRGQRFNCWSGLVAPNPTTHPCFQTGEHVECRCSNTTLDCSSNHGQLCYIPRVFSDAHIVNFSNNELRRLSDEHFFLNASRSVRVLDLFNNDMTYITPNVFRPLRKLKILLLGGNRLSYEALKPVFSIPTLTKLDLRCGVLGPIPQHYFNQTPAPNLQRLDMSWNNITTLDMRALQPLKSLNRFICRTNRLYQLNTTYLPSLMWLEFVQNRLFQFPDTCTERSTKSLFPNLVRLNLVRNYISTIPDRVCLPSLTYLGLRYNSLTNISSNMFSLSRFPVLRKLYIVEMESRVVQINDYAFNNSNLKVLDLGLNYIDFSSTAVGEDIFGGCSKMGLLSVSQNNFRTISTEKLQSFFRPMKQLTVLSMASVNLESITSDTFKLLPRLKQLYLYGNSLYNLPDGAFDQLPSLKILSLTSNHISSISSHTFDSSTQGRLHTLDLSGNPFLCGCDIVWFQQWFRKQPQKFPFYHHVGYRCSNVNKTLADYFIPDQACLLRPSTSTLLISSSCFLLLLYVLVVVVFGYRWQLRLWLYVLCRGRQQGRPPRGPRGREGGFTHDVFLAYAEEDGDWVLETLLPVLEGLWGLRVCLHQRDFLPGKHIMDNIADCVQGSDRVLMLFSPHFARSPWCQFELRFCQEVVMERQDVLLLLMLRDARWHHMSGAMLAVLKTTTYLEWGEEHEEEVEGKGARASFWGRLALTLNDVIPV